jgi:hypothetical protein
MSCGHRVEIVRPTTRYLDPPAAHEAKHDGCTSTAFRRVITLPMRIQINENEAQYWKDDNYK